jgi:hypothetical protein
MTTTKPTFRMGTVKSELISKVGYDTDTKTMRVEYSDGAVFDYHGISLSTYKKRFYDHTTSGPTG